MEEQWPSAVMEGSPHAAEYFRPPGLLVGVCVLCLTAVISFGGVFDAVHLTMICAAVGVSVVLWLALAAKRRAVCHWRWEDGVFYFTRGALMRGETAFRTDRLLYAETLRSPFASLLGGMRVKLYVEAADNAVFSAVLPRRQGDALLQKLMDSATNDEVLKSRNIISGQYAVLPAAVSDLVLLTLLSGAAVAALMGGGRFSMNVAAFVLWLGALVRLVERLLSEGKLSVKQTGRGWVIVKGIGNRSRLFIPDKSVMGIRESSTLPALLCGARRVELLCGGRRIPCMRWYMSSHPDTEWDESHSSLACGLLGCDGKTFAVLKNLRAVRKRYFIIGIAAICCAGVAGFVGWVSVSDGGGIGAIASALFIYGVTGVLLQCAAGVSVGRISGISVSPSSVYAAGMGLLTAETLTLRRGCLAGVRVIRTSVDRINGLCTVELIAKGCRRGVKCRCMPYERVQALLERFG